MNARSLVVLFVLVTATGALSAQQRAIEPIPAFHKGARILFQGDSITDGKRGRNQDPNHILGHGYVFIIAAKYGAAFPELGLTFINRGCSGHKVDDLAKRWQKDTLDLKPDILSILVGVNDHGRNVPMDEYEQGYDKLLADAVAANPRVRLVLCEPFTLPVGRKKAGYDAWLAGMQQRSAIVARLAKKYNAAFVPFQRAFDEACKRAPAEHWIWDGVHPTYSGHQIMADEWVRTVRVFWGEQ
jgi:lysophospholipase L1-like esterase